ncbi:MAG: hypothetical protein KKA73_12890 [Chloroflexi bacterium]|nr:hypothetical protein [Chloroflexota bacterium]MBU1748577.1 hypothetical protein [Chloroflexota bacterium]MBU1877649.1 hypothetical protein [Chloroflexota bacterium]
MNVSQLNQDWPVVLDQYNVQFLALDRQQDRWLVQLFQSHPDWQVDFQDEEAVRFVRRTRSAAPSARSGL